MKVKLKMKCIFEGCIKNASFNIENEKKTIILF